jgi:hypothetical protein
MIDFTKLDLITSVDLRNEENKGEQVYQLIYGSQLYGTDFDVYAKFQGTRVTLIDGKYEGWEITDTMGELEAYKTEKISLILLNYKGILNLGFSGKSRIEFNPNTKEKTFYLEVQGASDNIKDEFSFKEDETPLIVPKGELVRLLVQRILMPLPDFRELLSNVRNDSKIDQSEKLPQHPPVTPLFDSEYFERDGIDLYKLNDKPGMAEIVKAEMVRPGGRCNSGIVSLRY